MDSYNALSISFERFKIDFQQNENKDLQEPEDAPALTRQMSIADDLPPEIVSFLHDLWGVQDNFQCLSKKSQIYRGTLLNGQSAIVDVEDVGSARSLAEEAEFLLFANSVSQWKGLSTRVTVPLVNVRGDYILRWDDKYALVWSVAQGQAVCNYVKCHFEEPWRKEGPTPRVFHALGRGMADIHNIAAAYNKHRSIDMAADVESDQKEHHELHPAQLLLRPDYRQPVTDIEDEQVREAITKVLDEIANLEITNDAVGICHGDPHGQNYFVRELQERTDEGGQAASDQTIYEPPLGVDILDWDLMHKGHFLGEVALFIVRFMRYNFNKFLGSPIDEKEYTRHFLVGYHSVRPIIFQEPPPPLTDTSTPINYVTSTKQVLDLHLEYYHLLYASRYAPFKNILFPERFPFQAQESRLPDMKHWYPNYPL